MTINYLTKYKRSNDLRGMTLVEILVSLVMLSIILLAVYSILNLQVVRSIQVQRTSVMQTDAQVVLSLFKWDLSAIGLGFPKEDEAIVVHNGNPDSLTLRAVGLGFESNQTKWTWLLDKTNTTVIVVRRYSDPDFNFVSGDRLVILDANRKILNPPGPVDVDAVSDFTFYDMWGNAIPACSITVNNSVGAIAGLPVIGYVDAIYNPGITIKLIGDKLVRGNDTLLDNVENLQFAYGMDMDGDDIIETWSNTMPGSFEVPARKWAIRYTMVVTSRPMGGYFYPMNSYMIEDQNIMLTDAQRMRKRTFLNGIVSPMNLQP